MLHNFSRENFFKWIGILLIGLVSLFNEWLVRAFFSPDGFLETSTRIAIWIFDVALVLAGILVIKYGPKIYDQLFHDTDFSLKIIFLGGITLRILVYIFLRPYNNDNHIAVVEFIANHGAIPKADQLGQAYHPPLYYLLAAPFAVIGPAKFVQILSLLFSLVNLSLLYYLIKVSSLLHTLNAKRHALLLVVLLPQFVIFSNFVSNDTLAFLMGTLIFLQTFRYIDSPTSKNLFILSLILGLGLLTKGTLLSFLPVILILVIIVQWRNQVNFKRQIMALGLFITVSFVVGSYKYVENAIYFGKPFIGRDDLGHKWVFLQQGTYQGLKSIVDINILKLARYPFLSERTNHSLPLLLYGTFWCSYIPESNFRVTREYPWNWLVRTIYLLGIVPILLILGGAITCFLRILNSAAILKLQDRIFKLRLQEVFVLLILLSNLAVVIIWGLKHDAWSFFQARLLFAAFFSIAILFGIGYEVFSQWRTTLRSVLNGFLYFTYFILGIYLLVEMSHVAIKILS